MRAAGLRADDDAVVRGRDMVREWVKTGAGPQTSAAVRRQVADANLLARQGTLLLAIHAIDRPAHSIQPTVTVDLDLGDTDRERRHLRHPRDWPDTVTPRLHQAVSTLESYGLRRVHITGAMRLPLWFASGVRLPDIRGRVASPSAKEMTSPSPPASPTTPPATSPVGVTPLRPCVWCVGATPRAPRWVAATGPAVGGVVPPAGPLQLCEGVACPATEMLRPLAGPRFELGQSSRTAAAARCRRSAAGRRRRSQRWRVGAPMRHFDVPALGRAVLMPKTLIVHDRDDPMTPVAEAEAIAAAWVGSRPLVNSGLGHRRLLRDPAVVAEVVNLVTN